MVGTIFQALRQSSFMFSRQGKSWTLTDSVSRSIPWSTLAGAFDMPTHSSVEVIEDDMATSATELHHCLPWSMSRGSDFAGEIMGNDTATPETELDHAQPFIEDHALRS